MHAPCLALTSLHHCAAPLCAAQVPDDILVERVTGRRLDPKTGAIYHLKYKPAPVDVAPRLIQRSDDTEEKVRRSAACGPMRPRACARQARGLRGLGGSSKEQCPPLHVMWLRVCHDSR